MSLFRGVSTIGETIRVKFERRMLLIGPAFGQPVQQTSVFIVDSCLGHKCPGCPRVQPDWTFDGRELPLKFVSNKLAKDSLSDMIIRASGGDPLRYPHQVGAILENVLRRNPSAKLSLCTTGASPKIMKLLRGIVPIYLAAIDVKGDAQTSVLHSGLDPQNKAHRKICWDGPLQSIHETVEANIYCDVRTTIYRHTTYRELQNIARELPRSELLAWTIRMYDPVPVQRCVWERPIFSEVEEMVRELRSEFEHRMALRTHWDPFTTNFHYYIS